MSLNLTVQDVLDSQTRNAKLRDWSKTCATCKHKDVGEDGEPCNNCICSFMDIPFNPSDWEASNETNA